MITLSFSRLLCVVTVHIGSFVLYFQVNSINFFLHNHPHWMTKWDALLLLMNFKRCSVFCEAIWYPIIRLWSTTLKMWPSATAIAAASFAASNGIFATPRKPTDTSPLSLASLFSFQLILLPSLLRRSSPLLLLFSALPFQKQISTCQHQIGSRQY
jgi:hypothetical protein